jgi:hypothetical protein
MGSIALKQMIPHMNAGSPAKADERADGCGGRYGSFMMRSEVVFVSGCDARSQIFPILSEPNIHL